MLSIASRRRVPVVVLLLCSLWWCTGSATPAYELRVLVQPGDVIDSYTIDRLFGQILMNDDGEVVFVAFYEDTNGDVQRGIFSQPTFDINGDVFAGAPAYEVFAQTLDAYLAAAE